MIHKVITKTEFKKFINSLIDDNETFGPKQVDTRPDGRGIYQFKEIGSFDEMDLDYTVTYSSVKNFFLPSGKSFLVSISPTRAGTSLLSTESIRE
jgi:hypothetical protein